MGCFETRNSKISKGESISMKNCTLLVRCVCFCIGFFCVEQVFAQCKNADSALTHDAFLVDDSHELFDEDKRKPLQGKRLRFGEKVKVLGEDRQIGLLYVTNSNNSVCGWIAERALLKAKAVPVEMQALELRGEQYSDNTLYAKALIKNDPDSKRVAKRKTDEIVVSHRPGGEQKGTLTLYGIFFVYDQARVGKVDYLLLAGSLDDFGGDAIQGWVRRSDVYLWESRVAIFWGPEDEPSRIWKTEEDFRRSKSPMAVEPKGWREPEKKNLPRFALLDELEYTKPQKGTLFNIAFFGDGCDQITGECKPANTVLDELSTIREIVKGAVNVDVLFVIDGTESMTAYFPTVARAIRSLSSQIATRDGSTRVSVAMYGDYYQDHKRGGIQFEIKIPFGSPKDVSNVDELVDIAELSLKEESAVFPDGVGDLPEAAFWGIKKSAESAAWSKNSDFRVVIWIGDDGNRDKDGICNFEDGRRYGRLSQSDVGSIEIGVKDVAETLRANRLAFIPVNVKGRSVDDWNKCFIEQADKIIEAAAVPSFGPYVVYESDVESGAQQDDKLVSQDELNELESTLVESLGYALESSDAIPSTLGKVAGFTDNVVVNTELSATSAKFVEDWLSMFSSEDGKLGDVYSLDQVVTDGFAFNPEGKDSWTYWVSMNTDVFDTLKFFVQQLCGATRKASITRPLQNTFLTMTEVLGGDPLGSDESVSEYLDKVFHIPTKYFPSILNNSLEDLSLWWEDDSTAYEEKLDFHKSACRSRWLLNQVEENKRADESKLQFDHENRQWFLADQKDDEGRWIPENAKYTRTFDWSWGSVQGATLLFLPVQYLPQDASGLTN